MKKVLLVALCALGVVGCDSTKTYDITESVLCKFENDKIRCPEHNIKRPDNLVTDIYRENANLYLHAHKDGVIICELDFVNATDFCRDEQGNPINGIIKNYEADLGYLIQENIYKNGKMLKSVSYYENGIISSESTADGVSRAYNKDGKLVYITEKTADKIIRTDYDQNGNITNTKVLSK
ncbi:MAG: hypothetical protein IJE79_01570 [Alphaproteobacteria bacterium]|nr:hypothetical protein [Alphaproteobacteria bacterium]